METAYSPNTKTLYLLVNEFTLRSFHLTNNTFGKNDVTIDISGCDSGSGCFDELHYDAKNDRLIATGVGYPGGAANGIVGIDIRYWGGTWTIGVFSQCGMYLESSTFYTDIKQQFSWLSCLDNPREEIRCICSIYRPAPTQPLCKRTPTPCFLLWWSRPRCKKYLRKQRQLLVTIDLNSSTVVNNNAWVVYCERCF